MTKSELKTGMIVTLENGIKCMVLRDTETNLDSRDVIVSINRKRDWCNLKNFNEDMTNRLSSGYDIIEVSKASHPSDIPELYRTGDTTDTIPLWKRKEKKKYTYAQLREILGEEFEVVG